MRGNAKLRPEAPDEQIAASFVNCFLFNSA